MGLAALDGASRVLLLGAGREGHSTYTFIRQRRPQLPITIADQSPYEKLAIDFVAQLDADPQTTLITGDNYLDTINDYPLVIKSPGIPPHLPPLVQAQSHGTMFISNTQLFFELVPRDNIIGITGTKGKSTTTAFIHHVLSHVLDDVRLLGNIGLPPLDVLQSAPIAPQTHFVIEMSSYQLHDFPYSPHVAILQNIVPEHLTWHGTFEAYVEAKHNIFRHQTSDDWFLYNADGDQSAAAARLSTAQTVGFGLQHGDCLQRDSYITLHGEPLADVDDVPLRGEFNLLNAMPSIIIARQFGMDMQQIASALRSFKPLAHRLEYVTTVNGVDYYDDSLATVPEATVAALQGFVDKVIVLITGGHDRGVDYAPLATGIVAANIRQLILFPTTGERIESALNALNNEDIPPMQHVQTMTEAVELAANAAQAGDVVLMSPASASFNLFRNYADRSAQFKAAIANLQQ